MTVRYFPNPPEGIDQNSPDAVGWRREVAHELNIDEHIEVTTVDPAADELLIFSSVNNNSRKIKLNKCGGTSGGGGIGTVTSIGMTVPAEFSVSPASISTSGTFAITKVTETANTVWAGPTTGSATQPAFRSLVTADIANDMITYAKIQNVSAASRIIGRGSASGSGDAEELTLGGTLSISGTVLQDFVWWKYKLTNETTVPSTGLIMTDRWPACTLLDIRANVSTASTSGIPQIDIKVNGTTIFSTKLTIDANELTSVTAATPYVFSVTTIPDDAEIKVYIDTVGTGTKGWAFTPKVRLT